MELLKFTLLGVMLTTCCPITKAMGLCEFAEKSPCEDSAGLSPLQRPGCTNQTAIGKHMLPQPVTKDSSGIHSSPGPARSVGQLSSFVHAITELITTDQAAADHTKTDQVTAIHSAADKVTSGHSTTRQVAMVHAVSHQVTTSHPITDQVSSDHSTIDQGTTGHSTINQVTTGLSATDQETIVPAVTDSVITSHSNGEQVSPVHSNIDQVSTSHSNTFQKTSVSIGQSTRNGENFDNDVGDQVTTDDSTSGQMSPNHLITDQVNTSHAITYQGITGDSTSDQVTFRKVPTDRVTTGKAATDQETTIHSETDRVFATAQACSNNMVYAGCNICQSTCENPTSCITGCTEPVTCVCPNGLFLKGDDCVPEEECECFLEGHGVIPEGGFHVTSDCFLQCNCSAGQLVCDDSYQCSSNAVCEERDSIRRCYCNDGYKGNGVTCTSTTPATDCLDVFNSGIIVNGVYNIAPTTWSGSPFEVYCDMTDGGGWTVFQRRVDGTVNFNLYWDDFKHGFGFLHHEFWLGNEKIFALTNQKTYQLRIDLTSYWGFNYYAKYDSFRINNESNNYRITVGIYNEGNADDSLSASQNNEDFSTRDRDNDDYFQNNIAATPAYGAWWYGSNIYSSDLNANYYSGKIYWATIPGGGENIRFTEMKVRPV